MPMFTSQMFTLHCRSVAGVIPTMVCWWNSIVWYILLCLRVSGPLVINSTNLPHNHWYKALYCRLTSKFFFPGWSQNSMWELSKPQWWEGQTFICGKRYCLVFEIFSSSVPLMFITQMDGVMPENLTKFHPPPICIQVIKIENVSWETIIFKLKS